MNGYRLHVGDALEHLREMPSASVQVCLTSPPYWGMRDYGVVGQIGLESSRDEYLARLVDVFREVRRVLKKTGTLWLNIGDTYVAQWNGSAGSKSTLRQAVAGERVNGHEEVLKARRVGGPARGLRRKNLAGIPARLAIALQDDGWIWRARCVWEKANPIPESVGDRPTRSHEDVLLFAQTRYYQYDADAVRTPLKPKSHTTFGTLRVGLEDATPPHLQERIKARRLEKTMPERRPRLGTDGEPVGANLRDVWRIATTQRKRNHDHYATFPPELAEIPLRACSRVGDVVLDPFAGTCTTGVVALGLGCSFVGIELSPKYAETGRRRLARVNPLFVREEAP